MTGRDIGMKITIYDVAKKAGVSIATVSKVINNTGNIGEETRQKVNDVIKELEYVPNLMASALTGKRTQTIGLLIPDISNPFFSAMARYIEDSAHEKGMSVIMCSIDDSSEKEQKYIELLQRKQIDGLIVASLFYNENLLKDLIKKGIPVIMLAYDDSTFDVSIVSVDDFKGGYEAASHLFSKGHRKIAVIAEHTHSSDLRLYGYRVALEGRGIEFDEKLIYKTSASIENGKRYFEQIYMDIQPTAIFAFNDLLAIGVIKGATEKGIRIPDELAIIGFDNTILASTTVPGLTTIAQPIKEMALKTVEILIEEIYEQKRTKKRFLFDPELIIRGTT